MKHNDVPNIESTIPLQDLENLFNVYQDTNDFYFYNLSRTVYFPTNMDTSFYDGYLTQPKDTYPLIAWKFYKNVKLWWLICASNNIFNPVKQPDPGTPLKIIKPMMLNSILTEMAKS